MKLSVVSPVYNGASFLEELIVRIKKNVPSDFDKLEIILVDDYSPDGSWSAIESLSAIHEEVYGYKLSRNFGQHFAIMAGLSKATGDYVVVLDCDLQDQPEEIPRLYKKLQEGYHAVVARRYDRKDGFLKKLFSRAFYRTLSYLTGTNQDATVANFGIYSKAVIQEVVNLPEKIKFFPNMVKWVGFERGELDVEHAARTEGKSNYNIRKLINLAIDVILAYSNKPLRLIVKFGITIALVSFLMAIATFIMKLSGNIIVSGYASLIVSIWFLSGCILITLGILGLYIGKIFDSVKDRPIFIIEKQTKK